MISSFFLKRIAILFVVACAISSIAYAKTKEEAIANGAIIFKKCALCHFVDKDVNKIGPSLHNVVGRPAAAVKDYHYSEAMKQAGASGLIWTIDKLREYLQNPHKMIKGTKMAIVFIKKEEDFADLLSYMQSAGK